VAGSAAQPADPTRIGALTDAACSVPRPVAARLPDRPATALNRLSLLNQRSTAPKTAKVEVELRARDGRKWEDAVRAASVRQSQDAQFSHMMSTDTENPLAYLDYSQLRQLIDGNWTQFAPTFIHRPAWECRQDELTRIRHGIGHMRLPRQDDLTHIEQTLRDLAQQFDHGGRVMKGYVGRGPPG
jgi:hypothetical protein